MLGTEAESNSFPSPKDATPDDERRKSPCATTEEMEGEDLSIRYPAADRYSSYPSPTPSSIKPLGLSPDAAATNPCSGFVPYAPPGHHHQAAGPSVYPAPHGGRYHPASHALHLGLPPMRAMCATGPGGRSSSHHQFSSSSSSSPYPFGHHHPQAAGCIYPPYPSPGSGGCGLGAALSLHHAGASGGGLRAQVYLCNRPLWLKFHRHQTEMIITKQGR